MVATTTCTCNNNYYNKKNDDGWRPEPVKSPTNYYDQMVGNANIFIIDIWRSDIHNTTNSRPYILTCPPAAAMCR